MEKIRAILRRKSLSYRLIVAYIAVTVIPLLVISIGLFYQSTSYINDINRQYVRQTQDYVSDKLEVQLNAFDDSIAQWLYQSEFSVVLPRYLDGQLSEVMFKYHIGEMLNPDRLIDAVIIYDDQQMKSTSVIGNREILSKEISLDPSIYLEAELIHGRILYHIQWVEDIPRLMATRKMYRVDNNDIQSCGYFTLLLNQDFLNLYDGLEFKGDISISLNDIIIFDFNDTKENNQDSFLVEGTVEDMFGVHTSIERSIVNEDIQKMSLRLMVFALALFFISFISNKVFSETIATPLKLLSMASRRVSDGDFDIQIAEEGNDEITDVVKSFNLMVVKLKALIYENYEIKLREKDYKLKDLQGQINPHFLYNTLDMMRFRAMKAEDEDLSNDIQMLSSMFKEMLNDKQIVTLDEELQYLKMYMYFQKEIYKEGIEISYHIDEGAIDCKVVKFMLQMVVENSILHGMSEDSPCLHIMVDVTYQSDQEIIIEVTDDGKGSNKTCPLLQREDNEHIGLYNLNARIKEAYGEGYGLVFESKEGIGTLVRIRIKNSGD